MRTATVNDAAFAIASQLSSNLGYTPEGYLIIRAAVIARTATRKPQKYRGWELGIANDDSLHDVYRSPEEVFHPTSLASGEGKAVTLQHPHEFLDPQNTGWYSRGHMTNLRRGHLLDDGERALLGDLVVTDAAAIEEIASGRLRQLSLGYRCKYVELDDGSGYEQTAIVINHCSIVFEGRARTAEIRDSSQKNARDAVRAVTKDREETMTNDAARLIDNITAKLERFCEVTEQLLAQQAKDAQQPRTRTLADEADSIVRASRRTEELTAKNLGPSSLHAALARSNDAYRTYDQAAKEGQSFSDAAKAAGRELEKKFIPARLCTTDAAPIREHDADGDWADTMNTHGKRLRERR